MVVMSADVEACKTAVDMRDSYLASLYFAKNLENLHGNGYALKLSVAEFYQCTLHAAFGRSEPPINFPQKS